MIACKLSQIKRNSSLQTDQDQAKIKYGQYLSSYFHIKGYGKKCWVIAVNIEVDHSLYLAQGVTSEQLVRGCIEHLNFPPKSKYGKKRRRQPLYGKLRGVPYSFKLKTKNNKQIIEALLVTERQRSKHFWGEGIKANYSIWGRRKKQ
jgi:hypothetical protein